MTQHRETHPEISHDVDRLLEVIHSEAHAAERCNKECELWHRLTRLPRWPIEAWIAARVEAALAELLASLPEGHSIEAVPPPRFRRVYRIITPEEPA